MDPQRYMASLDEAVTALSDPSSQPVAFRHVFRDKALPSVARLKEFVDLCKAVLFPGFFDIRETSPNALKYQVGHHLEAIYRVLSEQAELGLCFECGNDNACAVCGSRSEELALSFIKRLPEIRRLLATDVEAAYDGDPAAKSVAEIIFCYPSITALTHHRIAHELLKLGLPIIPRIISEAAHSATGMDIHPGATVGERFFVDHCTGVVIGETAVIGNNVRLYQGVSLGAKSFPKDEKGNPIKGIPRHPIVEDDVIVYAGATVLGRITIGRGSVVSGNAWVTEDIPPGTKVKA